VPSFSYTSINYLKDRKVKQILSGKHKESVKDDNHGANIMYSCMKMKKMRSFETILRRGRGRKARGGENSTEALLKNP
jgi:hypothetical protein